MGKTLNNANLKSAPKRITDRVDISRNNSNTKVYILKLSKSAEKALSMKKTANHSAKRKSASA